MDMGLFLNSLLAVSATIFAFVTVRRRQARDAAVRQHDCHPTTKHWPADIFFGLDFIIRTHSNFNYMTRCFARYGLTYQLDSFFGKPTITTIAPENLQAIYTRFRDFGVEPERLPPMEYFCGRGFLTTDGEISQRSRKMMKPTFSKSNISDLRFLSLEIDQFIAKVPKNGETVDLQPLLFLPFLNIALRFLLGVDPHSKSHDGAPSSSEGFVEAFHAALFGTGLRIILGKFRFLMPKGQYRKDVQRAHEYLEHYIKRALEENSGASPLNPQAGQKQRSMIQGLAAQVEGEPQMDDIHYIRSQILQGMMASQETTAVLLSNTLFLLARHPKYWEQLRAEVQRAGDELFDFDNLSNFKLLQNMLNECKSNLTMIFHVC